MSSPWDIRSLNELSEHIWNSLVQAEDDPLHPWRLPVLATSGAEGPNARKVVLRGVTRPGFELLAFSDTRSAKVEELTFHPAATWLFYDPQWRVQLRAYSEIRLHSGDTVADTYWHRLPARSRPNYQSDAAPGAPVEDPTMALGLAEGGADHFTVIVGRVIRLDWLWLAPEHHRRAIFWRAGAGWTGQWTVP